MAIGPFSTYAPPGVYTQTIQEPVIGALVTGLRVPTFIGTGRETISQTDFEIVRGSSASSDTPIFGEDITGRYVIAGPNANPVLGPTDGNKTRFRVRNYPIVNGLGTGTATFSATDVSVSVNGEPVAVAAVDGPTGVVTLLVPPADDAFVIVNYYFRRKDTRVTYDVSDQVTSGPAVLYGQNDTSFNISSSNDVLQVYVNDSVTASSIKLTHGSAQTVANVVSDIILAGVTGLSAFVYVDQQGLSKVGLSAAGNVKIGAGTANGALGFNANAYTGRNRTFYVFNGPMVNGDDSGTTTTSISSVAVLVNNTPVIVTSVEGQYRAVTLQSAPVDGSTVSVAYWYNAWQDTFDYLPNNNIITSSVTAGQNPGSNELINGVSFVVVNDGDQSKIVWGTAYTVTSGLTSSGTAFDDTQISGLLIDNKMFGAELSAYVDPNTAVANPSKWVLPLVPTTGNGRDTVLSYSYFESVANGRQDLTTDNPNLVVAYVGKTWRDAYAKGPVVVTEVNGNDRLITLKNAVHADYKVYATFYYNTIKDARYTFSVGFAGQSGIGTYSIVSSRTGTSVYGARFGSVTGISQTITWPSGSETLPDAIYSGSGVPVSETVTVTFQNSLEPATHASVTNPNAGPYDIYEATKTFGNIIIDGITTSVDLSTSFKATYLGQPVANPSSFLSSDRLYLEIDGIDIQVDVSSATSMAQVVSAINGAIDADTTVHSDGTGTFASTAPNGLAEVVLYGSEVILKISSRSAPSDTDGLISSVKIMPVTGSGETDVAASGVLGVAVGDVSYGSYNALNQAAFISNSVTGPFTITTGLNDKLALNVDGNDLLVTIPGGSTSSVQVAEAINDAYVPFMTSSQKAQQESDLVDLVNDIVTQYTSHIPDSVFHAIPDTNNVASGTATTLSNSITILTALANAYNKHISNSAGTFAFSVSSTNNVAGEFELVTNVAHGLSSGQTLVFSGFAPSGINGTWDISVTGSTSFTLTGSSYAAGIVTNGSISFPSYHNTPDTADTVSVPTLSSSDLQGALVFAHAVKRAYNLHLENPGSHGTDDNTNVVTTSSTDSVTITGTANAGGLIEITTSGAHSLTTGQYVIVYGVAGTTEANGTWKLTTTAANKFTLDGSTFTNAYVSGGNLKSMYQVYTLINSQKAQYNAHRVDTDHHIDADTTNVVSTASLTVTSTVLSSTLVNEIKAKFNAHRTLSGVHVVNDTTNIITTANADVTLLPEELAFESIVALAEAIANTSSGGAYNGHRSQTQGAFHVHGTNDTTNVVTISTTSVIANSSSSGTGQYDNYITLTSLTNNPNSNLTVKSASDGSSALTKLGFIAGTYARTQPSASKISAALNANSTFAGLAAVWPLSVSGYGTFLRIDSLTSGFSSSLAFSSSPSNTAFVIGTGLGIDSSLADVGQDAVSGFEVTSSDPVNGSSGYGQVGQTYTDAKTGLRFSILEPTSGDYDDGGYFTLVCGTTFTCDSSKPIYAVDGVELTVTNTVGVITGNTAIVDTYSKTGAEPQLSEVYYVSYQYRKTSYAAALYTDLKRVVQNYGPATPDYPLSLAARLAILNGAVVVGLKQVPMAMNSALATDASYISAIDDLKKPISGNIKPDIIVPLTGSPTVAAYLGTHCAFMSAPRQESERMGVVGTSIGTSVSGVSTLAKGLNSSQMVVVYPDSFVAPIVDNLGNSTNRLVEGAYMAAALASTTCSPAIDVATPWTRRSVVGFSQVGRILDPTTMNQIAVNGVSLIEQVDTGLRVRHGLTTKVDNVINRTPSVTLTIQYVQQQIRGALDPFIGQKFVSSIPKQVEDAISSIFTNLITSQIVSKVVGITATVDPSDPTVLRTEVIYVPVFPLEYIVCVLQIRVKA